MKAVCIFIFFAELTALAAPQPIYRLEARKDFLLLGNGLGVGAAALILQNQQTPLTPADVDRLNPDDVIGIDRSATTNYSLGASHASDYLVAALLVSPVSLLLEEETRNDAITLGVMFGETLLLTGGITGIFKGSFYRTRPFVYNPQAPLSEKTTVDARRSFFSSHSSIAFSTAVYFSSVFSAYHPRSHSRSWIWAGTLAAASVISYLRYASGSHFPTDIATGAAVGATIGWAIPEMHRIPNQSKLFVIPFTHGDQVSVLMQLPL